MRPAVADRYLGEAFSPHSEGIRLVQSLRSAAGGGRLVVESDADSNPASTPMQLLTFQVSRTFQELSAPEAAEDGPPSCRKAALFTFAFYFFAVFFFF